MMDIPDTIYLLDTVDGILWCEDRAPGVGMDPEDSIPYVRVDSLPTERMKRLIAKLRMTVPFDDRYPELSQECRDLMTVLKAINNPIAETAKS